MVKLRLAVLYALAILAIGYGVSQLGEKRVSAEEAGTCCGVSSDCAGELLCYDKTGGERDCCTQGTPDCKGTGYCKVHGLFD